MGAFLPLAMSLRPSAAVAAKTAGKAGERWTFDSLDDVGGMPVRSIGSPGLTPSPWGPAMAFDGTHDALLVDRHPLAGAGRFTFEALFRPDGGAFQQRWFHLESCDAATDPPGTSATRMMFEIRVVGENWYLDAFVTGPGYKQPLMMPAMLWPIGRWHHVAQSYDGQIYRSFLNGHLQASAAIDFTPQGPGRASIGARLNGVDHFRGAVRAAHFSRRALRPSQFRLLDRHLVNDPPAPSR
ncbi:LamG-like jellyroll fold domain-containing protein [Sphingomonas abietis]|uniref:LamG domain-containing protein n=1 Tax=Sphingomonas abietis TaxID=3012344 RepID=A0ABY7NU00_9SPHN|nr:LamG-like jellyroll fold domain-containing protein [Sphingomonas abietis]WBO22926.1 LamG domain-containing protein [Sphingomonas abietis]